MLQSETQNVHNMSESTCTDGLAVTKAEVHKRFVSTVAWKRFTEQTWQIQNTEYVHTEYVCFMLSLLLF